MRWWCHWNRAALCSYSIQLCQKELVVAPTFWPFPSNMVWKLLATHRRAIWKVCAEIVSSGNNMEWNFRFFFSLFPFHSEQFCLSMTNRLYRRNLCCPANQKFWVWMSTKRCWQWTIESMTDRWLSFLHYVRRTIPWWVFGPELRKWEKACDWDTDKWKYNCFSFALHSFRVDLK